MTEENIAGGLTAEEQAYFDSEGETSFEAETPEIVTEEAAAPETVDEKDGEAQAEIEGKGERDEKGRFVNYGALHAERTKRQQLEQEVGGLKQFKAAMEEKMRWTEALLTPQEQKVEDDPMPDPNVDIFAHSQWQARQLEKLNAKVNEREQQETQAKEAQEYEQKVWSHWHQSSQQYKAENPDFENAVKWMSETRDGQLKALAKLNPRLQSEAGRVQQINAELKEIVVAAAQAQISPAQYIYEMAKDWGYAVKAAEPIDPAKLELPGKLKGIEQAQQGSRTVGQAAGARSGGEEITIDSLAAMPQGEFNEWMKVPANEKRFKSLMGG